MPSVWFPTDHTPEEWREMQRERYRRSAESFERCDTDGFLSQGAAEAMARLFGLCAEIAENGGKFTFEGVADAEMNLLDAELCMTRYGYAWRIERDGNVEWFNESQAKDPERRKAANLRKGFVMVQFECKAVVISAGFNGGYAAPKHGAERTIIGESEY